MAADRSIIDEVLTAVPQQAPFRFIDDILELDEHGITGRYRFREDEYFYRGHFPDRPITPGVILIETMAQTGVVAFGLYLKLLMGQGGATGESPVTLFTLAENVEFKGVVQPGDEVIVTGEKVYFRGNQLKVAVSMARPDGEEVSSGVLAGMGIARERFAAQGNSGPAPAAAGSVKEGKKE